MAAAELSRRHPHLVVVSVTPFGLEGPAAGRVATELVAQSLAGVVYRSGVPELPPVSAPGSYCEDVGAVVGALAGLIALHQADDDAGGQLVDVSSILALAQCTEMSLPIWSLLQSDQVRMGGGLYPLFPCTDGLARIVLPMSPAEWRSLIAWMGSPPEWTGPAWEGAMLGVDERAQIMSRLPEMFAVPDPRGGHRRRRRRRRAGHPGADPGRGARQRARGRPGHLRRGRPGRRHRQGVHRPVRDRRRPGAVRRTGHRRSGPVMAGPSERPAGTAEGAALPLAGIRVLEIGSGVAAPEAGRVLGEWGAEVIKVESRRRPDFQRMVMGGEMNPAFSTVARNKLALGADLATEAGRDLVRQLIPSIDVVVENNATGVIDRLGLGWDVLHAANPGLVLVSTQLYGDRGPWALRKGYGPSARAVGGLTWLWAHGPDAPRGVMTIHPDHLAGRMVALGALAGLRAAPRAAAADATSIWPSSRLCRSCSATSSWPRASGRVRRVPTGNGNDEHAPWGLYRGARRDRRRELAGDLRHRRPRLGGAARGGGRRRARRAGLADPRPDGWRRRRRWTRPSAAGCATRTFSRSRSASRRPGWPPAWPCTRGCRSSTRRSPAGAIRSTIDQPGSGPLILEGPAFRGARMGDAAMRARRRRCRSTPLRSVASCWAWTTSAVQALVEAGAVDAAPEDPAGG